MIFKNELGILSAEKTLRQNAFISAGGKIGSVKSEILRVSLAESAKPLSMFYRGSDFTRPDSYASSSVNQLGKGRIAAIYFNAGTCYTEYKTFVIRDLVNETINNLFTDKIVEISGSKLLHVTVNKLNDRVYINLINVAGNHTGHNTIGYDEVPSLKEIEVAIKSDSRPYFIRLQPEGKNLKYQYKDGRYIVKIPEIAIHSILELI